jgi:hypothetical protein
MGKIRIRHGENEIELEGTDKFIKKQIDAFYEKIQRTPFVSAPATLKQDIQASAERKPIGKVPTPAEFYKSKKRTDGIAQILIFGKYLEEFRGQAEFSRQDINKMATDARIGKNIHGQFFTNAVKQGLLRNLGRGNYSLTLSAEEALASMK